MSFIRITFARWRKIADRIASIVWNRLELKNVVKTIYLCTNIEISEWAVNEISPTLHQIFRQTLSFAASDWGKFQRTYTLFSDPVRITTSRSIIHCSPLKPYFNVIYKLPIYILYTLDSASLLVKLKRQEYCII
jgi:hypothetical protein